MTVENDVVDAKLNSNVVGKFPNHLEAGILAHGAAIKNQTMLAHCSYGPYSRAMVRICAEESFHNKQGKEMVYRYALGTSRQRAMSGSSMGFAVRPAAGRRQAPQSHRGGRFAGLPFAAARLKGCPLAGGSPHDPSRPARP